MRVFGKHGFYLKNAESIENLARTDTIVFDKTGTLTHQNAKVEYKGDDLSEYEKELLAVLTSNSIHPASRSIQGNLNINSDLNTIGFNEQKGQGMIADINGTSVYIGKQEFINPSVNSSDKGGVFLSVDKQIKGEFLIRYNLREEAACLINSLKKNFSIHVLSGDNSSSRIALEEFLSSSALHFNMSPHDKLEFITEKRKEGHKVIMIGDGLNDSGALKESNFGITIAEDVNAFTPASDAILDASQIGRLPEYVKMAKASKKIIFGSFIFSAAYNFIGISFAVRGELQPLVAALLMPLSSITVLLYTQFAVKLTSLKYSLK